MKRRGRPLIVVLLGIAAGIAILGATQQPASASFGSLEMGDFLLTVGNANVRHVRPGAVDEVASYVVPAPSTQYGLCLDSANNIYVTNYEANTVTKLDPAGNILANPWVSFGGKSLNPTSCTVDSSGDVYIGMGSVLSLGAARLLRFNPDGTPDPTHPSYTLAAPTPTSEIWVDLMHGDECVAAYSAGDDLIREWNVCTDMALTTRFQRGSGGSSVCHGVRFTPIDHLLAACDDHAYKWDPSDAPDSFGNIQPIAPPGTGTYDNPNLATKFYDVDTDPSGTGDTFWVTAADTSSSTNEVLQFTYSSSTHIGGVTVGVSPAVRGIAVVQSCVCPTPTSTTTTTTAASTPAPPVVTLTADPSSGLVPLAVRLFGTAKIDPSATIASWQLNYDDPTAPTNEITTTNGATNAQVTDDGHTRRSTGPLPSPLAEHIYQHASFHKPTLFVIDSNGKIGQASTTITLSDPSPTFASSSGTAAPTFFVPFTPFVGGSSTPFFPQTFPSFPQPTFPPFTTQVTWAPTAVTWAPMAAPAASPPAPAPAANPPAPAAAASPPAVAPPPARTTPAPSPAPPTALPPVPPPSVLPLDVTASPVVARNLLLSLSRNSAEPGGDVTATGEGCDANSPVWLELDGRPVGSTAADGAGHFRAPLDLKNTSIGDYDVLAHCGPTLQTRLAVTQTQKLDQPLSSILMLLFVLLGGAVVVRSALGVG
jgi:hypothetical protein